MFQNQKISVVIPAYNEAETIPAILAEIEKLGVVDETIVVDDGSKDQTVSKVSQFKNAKLIHHPYNLGNGASIKDGYRTATGDIIINMDGDGQHDPKDIPRFLEEMEKGYDMVVGARTAKQQAGIHRGIANTIYNLFASYVTRFKIQDLTSGMKASRKDFVKSIISLLPNSFSWPSTSTLALLRTGRSLKYIPINLSQRKGGKSKIRPFSDGIRFLTIILRIATLFSPFRVFLPISGILILAGLVYSIITIVFYGTLANLGTLLLSTGIIIFMIGLVSEQISQIRIDKGERKN